MSEVPDVLRGVLRSQHKRLSTVEMREFGHQQWRLWALGEYCGLLVWLTERHGLIPDLAERIERTIAEASRTQLWLDQTADAITSQDSP